MEELGQRMSIREFFDWQHFAQQHPFPADLIDFHAARMATMFASVNRAPNAPAPAVRDYLLIRDTAPKPAPKAAPKPARITEAQRIRAALTGG